MLARTPTALVLKMLNGNEVSAMKVSHYDFVKGLKEFPEGSDQGSVYLTIPETPKEDFYVECSISKQAPTNIWLLEKCIPVETQEQVWAIHDHLKKHILKFIDINNQETILGTIANAFVRKYLWKSRAFYKQVFGTKKSRK